MTINLLHDILATGQERTVNFPSRVVSATAQMSSFSLSYTLPGPPAPAPDASGDHHIQDVQAAVQISSLEGTKVSVRATGMIQDSSGNSGGGEVGFLLVVETE